MNRGKCKPCAFKSHKFLFRGLGVVLVHWGVVLGCLCTPSPTFPSLRKQQTNVKIRNVKNRSSKNLHGMHQSVTANPMLVSPSVWCSLRQLGKYLALVNLSHPPLDYLSFLGLRLAEFCFTRRVHVTYVLSDRNKKGLAPDDQKLEFGVTKVQTGSKFS